MNRGRAILAFILIAIGLVWIGQGTAILPGSGPMTGQSFWAWVGVVLVVIGVVIAAAEIRSRRAKTS
jgi:heme/copper-type cytochrome/quinol oxidase subunit 2